MPVVGHAGLVATHDRPGETARQHVVGEGALGGQCADQQGFQRLGLGRRGAIHFPVALAQPGDAARARGAVAPSGLGQGLIDETQVLGVQHVFDNENHLSNIPPPAWAIKRRIGPVFPALNMLYFAGTADCRSSDS